MFNHYVMGFTCSYQSSVIIENFTIGVAHAWSQILFKLTDSASCVTKTNK